MFGGGGRTGGGERVPSGVRLVRWPRPLPPVPPRPERRGALARPVPVLAGGVASPVRGGRPLRPGGVRAGRATAAGVRAARGRAGRRPGGAVAAVPWGGHRVYP